MNDRPAFVLLGASNVELALGEVVTALARRAHGPFDVFAAIGHGRSYGTASRYLARALPSIGECGLWAALERARPSSFGAIVADVGNDLMYGADAQCIAAWVEDALARLDRLEARTTIVGLPRERLERVTPLGFAALSALVFPFHPRREFETVRDAARELDDALRRLAGTRAFVEPPLAWYGLDPIHVRRGMRSTAWERIVDGLGPVVRAERGLSSRDRRALRAARAERRALFGRWSTHAQPAARLEDGSTISLF